MRTICFSSSVTPWPSGERRGTPSSCLKLRCAEGREFDPRPGQYSRMSFSSDQVTGTVFSHLKMPFLPKFEFIYNIVLVGKR